jgi:hypothetical protein
VFESVAVTCEVDDLGVVPEAVDHGGDGGVAGPDTHAASATPGRAVGRQLGALSHIVGSARYELDEWDGLDGRDAGVEAISAH